jgi:hypothetical protein
MTESDVLEKRGIALKTLQDFVEWQGMTDRHGHTSQGNQLLITGLTERILTCDEEELDRMTGCMHEFNSTSMVKKMQHDL